MAANRPDSGQNRASDPSLRPSWPIRTPVDSVAAAIRDASGEHGRGQAARMLLHRRSLPTAPGSVTEVIAGTPACSEAPRRSSRGRSTHRPSRDLTGPGRRTRASARTGRLAERAGEPIQAATEAREGSHGGWGARHQPCDPQASARTLHASPATWHVRCWKVTTLETGPATRRRSRPGWICTDCVFARDFMHLHEQWPSLQKSLTYTAHPPPALKAPPPPPAARASPAPRRRGGSWRRTCSAGSGRRPARRPRS